MSDFKLLVRFHCDLYCAYFSLHVGFLNGISNRYDDKYPEILEGIVSVEDFERTMNSLHNRIVSHWPCDTCYLFGVGCAPCTLGLSLFCPNTCVMMAEREAIHFLEDISLSARYYDRGITWAFRKDFFESWIELEIPICLLPDKGEHSLDNRQLVELNGKEEEKSNLIS